MHQSAGGGINFSFVRNGGWDYLCFAYSTFIELRIGAAFIIASQNNGKGEDNQTD